MLFRNGGKAYDRKNFMTSNLERPISSRDSLEIIRPYVERIQDQPDVQIMGGLGSAALASSDVSISYGAKEVRVPAGFSLPSHRPDGSLRDADILVLSGDASRIAEVDAELQQIVGNSLERSVFGVRPKEALVAQMQNPLGFRAFRTFVSDRYDLGDNQLVKALYPFSVPIHPESLETWSLHIGDERRIPIPHPGTTIANYTNRSISGIRPKDVDKVAAVAHNVFTKAPELREWLVDGAGASQLELSAVVASLSRDRRAIEHVLHGIQLPAYTHAQLIEHDAFIPRELTSTRTKQQIIATAAFKAEGLHFFESNKYIVSAWQKYAEKRAGAIVKNS